jgi:hypothetical protein
MQLAVLASNKVKTLLTEEELTAIIEQYKDNLSESNFIPAEAIYEKAKKGQQIKKGELSVLLMRFKEGNLVAYLIKYDKPTVCVFAPEEMDLTNEVIEAVRQKQGLKEGQHRI